MIATDTASPGNYYSTENNGRPVDWPLVWARKFRKDLVACGKTGRGYTPVIKEFIGTLNRHPKNTRPEEIIGLIENARPAERERYRDALTFFFSTTVPVGFAVNSINSCTFNETESCLKSTDSSKKSNSVLNTEQPSGRSVGENSRSALTGNRWTENPCIQEKQPQPPQNNTSDEKTVLLERLKKEVKVRDYSSSTLRNYISAVTQFLERLRPESSADRSEAFKEHIIWLRDKKGLAASTVNNYAASISFFFEEVLEVKPGEDLFIRMKTGNPLPRIHSRETVGKILTAPRNAKHRLMLMFAYGCGLRLGEIRSLKPTDIDFDRKVVWVRKDKGKKDRIIMLDQDIAPFVTAWMKIGCSTTYLFEGYVPGKAISKRTIEKVYDNACSKPGIDNQGGIHSLRHSFATHLLEQGISLRYIQNLLGHASSKTTEIYTHVAAHKITEIRSPIAGLLKTAGGSKDEL